MKTDDLKDTFNKWADEKFGIRPLRPAAIHLLREIDEWMESKSAEELVDCWFIAIHIVHRLEKIAGETGIDFYKEATNKFKILKKREWMPPDKEGVIEHKR